MVGGKCFVGNPYNGHTLAAQISQCNDLIHAAGSKVKQALVDLGWRGVRGIVSLAAALRKFDSCSRHSPTAQATAELVREEYRQRIESLHPTRLAFQDHPDSLRPLHVALVAAQRKELIRLCRAQEIGDETLHEIGLIQNFPNSHFFEIRRKQSAL